MDPSWSARQIAQEARQSAEHKYRDHPEIVELCDIAAGAAHTGLLPLLNPEERSTLHDSPVVVAPTAEFNAWTATAPSGDGNYIVFDLCIVTELAEFFSSVPGSEQRYAAWAACVLTGARRKTTGPLTNLALTVHFVEGW